MNKHPSISVFFPFLNDWGTVGSLVGLAVSTAEKLTDDWEVILVNDGSTEENAKALHSIVKIINQASKNHESRIMNQESKFQKNKEKIRIISHEKNKGYGGALRSGFEHATKDLVFYTDCDAQYDPRELALLFQEMKPGVSMVNGYKIRRNDPLHRIVAGKLYHFFVKAAFKLPIRDTDCDFRLIRRDVFDKIRLFEDTGTICVELVKKVDHSGFKIAEVPVHHYWRTSGKSQFFNFERLMRTAQNLVKLWWKLMVKEQYIS